MLLEKAYQNAFRKSVPKLMRLKYPANLGGDGRN